MIKIATPISKLFNDTHNKEQININSDCLECRDESIHSDELRQELFHCELQPIHNFSDAQIEYLKKIKSSKRDLKVLTFHIASCCDKPTIVNNIFQVGGHVFTRQEMLENALVNFSTIRDIFGSDLKLAVENNNYYPSQAYEYVTDPDFISQIVFENNIHFLLDVSHAKITAYNKKVDYQEYKKGLPLDRLLQLHVCKSAINNNDLMYDAHDNPDEEELSEVRDIINSFDVRYITVEYYKDTKKLIDSLKTLKKITHELS